jgi:hypothetical protein
MPDERRAQQATLGCGTLILIDLIVMIFSGHGPNVTNLENEVRMLRSEVTDLKKAVDSETNEIKGLHERLDRLQVPGAEKAPHKEMTAPR